jgi:acyl-CoA synthetase (AMP-forming)/AMP-acid ligase II
MGACLAESLLSLFESLCQRSPNQVILTFVNDHGKDEDSVTARQLASAAENIACALRDSGISADDRLLLAYPPSIDFFKAFVACWMAKVIPVPVCPPSVFSFGADLLRLDAIAADCGATAVLTNTGFDGIRRRKAEAASLQRGQGRQLSWYCTDTYSEGNWSFSGQMPTPEETALLQYTSGSTGMPKGVVVSHRNLHDDILANMRGLHANEESHSVLWVPHYHDMGLISMLCAVAGKLPVHFMSPLTFLRHPSVWFDVMVRVRATHTAAPNFALALAVRKTTAEMRARWDLRPLRSLLCGAEPIRAKTVCEFTEAFAASGFDPQAFYTAYGLAEHTLSVTFRRGLKILRVDKEFLEYDLVVPLDQTSARPMTECISCGVSEKPNARVQIVDADTGMRCPPGRVGEIWLHSTTKTHGYYRHPQETCEAFQARLAQEDDTTEYLRTGDLGFIHDGELYVTGRRKDLIVIHGRSLYPQDIEHTVLDAHPWIRPGGIVAFPYEDPTAGECVALVIETRQSLSTDDEVSGLIHAVRRTVFESHHIACHTVILSRGCIKKTTSGKVRRRACKQAYLNGEFHQAATTICIQVLPSAVPEFAASS